MEKNTYPNKTKNNLQCNKDAMKTKKYKGIYLQKTDLVIMCSKSSTQHQCIDIYLQYAKNIKTEIYHHLMACTIKTVSMVNVNKIIQILNK